MKKLLMSITATLFVTGLILISCNTPTEKVENAQKNVIEANSKLDVANEEYIKDVESYRMETADKININEEKITELKENFKNIKKESKAEYKKKLTELEQKNQSMKEKLANYKEEGKEKWMSFKAEFAHNMDEFGKAFSDFTKNNVK